MRKEHLQFREKPNPEEIATVTTNTINAGIYLREPGLLDLIPKGENCSFEYNVFPDIINLRKPFYAYVLKDEYWRDIGTPASYLEAHYDFLSGKIKGFEIEKSNNSDIATAAIVDKNSIIGDDCIIKPNARVINSILGAGVHVEEKATIENSVVWSHTRVSAAAEIRNCA